MANDPLDTAPTTSDLEQVMRRLRMPHDPVYIPRDHGDARCRAELLAHISAWVVAQLTAAESAAGLTVDDCVDLHWRADRGVAETSRHVRSVAPPAALQIARLSWAHHVMARAGGMPPTRSSRPRRPR